MKAARSSDPTKIDEKYLELSRIGQETSFVNGGFQSWINSPVKGIIVGEDDSIIILKLENEDVGTTHVYFPKLNY
ncbi:hypothetical protein fh0823_04600 [Francisella halioticida]|uniref:Uncharacterized protein n=1 Tax=Francisella halioticida TaxID=549298 RepID=A0ABN5AV19_9GAMM|nr:hypothetical protein [Francisella halioticida]ASG67729.1 hypothetical protein CDV26_04370 [Francisella halioticida]BCD90321.1 hypothetical protein fh0823_04600 [Francisella halioticida]